MRNPIYTALHTLINTIYVGCRLNDRERFASNIHGERGMNDKPFLWCRLYPNGVWPLWKDYILEGSPQTLSIRCV